MSHVPPISFLPEEGLPAEESVGAGLLFGLDRRAGHGPALEVDPELLVCLPEDLMVRYRVLPLAVEENRMRLAMVDPGDVVAMDDVRSHHRL